MKQAYDVLSDPQKKEVYDQYALFCLTGAVLSCCY